MFLAIALAVFGRNYFCMSQIAYNRAVYLVNKLRQPSHRQDKHNADNVQHILNAYGLVFHLVSGIPTTMVTCAQNLELLGIFAYVLLTNNYILYILPYIYIS